MLQKLFVLVLGAALVGHLFFRPQLKQLGQRIDRFVTLMVVAIVLTWAGQILFLILSRK
jgi:hypothetical protein